MYPEPIFLLPVAVSATFILLAAAIAVRLARTSSTQERVCSSTVIAMGLSGLTAAALMTVLVLRVAVGYWPSSPLKHILLAEVCISFAMLILIAPYNAIKRQRELHRAARNHDMF